MKLVIIGGIAGGMSAAARARRLSEDSQIIIFERGSDVSFGTCGMPYYLGGVITDRSKLNVVTPKMLRERFLLDLRLHSNVEKIDRNAKKITVRDLTTNRVYEESYDKLILSPGAMPIKPPISGIDLPGIFTLRNSLDMDHIKKRLDLGVKTAAIIGAGFIGIELVENLVRLGIHTSVIELQDQVLPPFVVDKEMSRPIIAELQKNGVSVYLGAAAQSFSATSEGIDIQLTAGVSIRADIVILGVGVQPDSSLAIAAGIATGVRGGIKVNDQMQTNDPDIYAVGDAVEITNFVTGELTQIPLAGPANRQGRIAADNIFGRMSRYRGTQGTCIVGIFDIIAATTGASEKTLLRAKKNYLKVYTHAGHHAEYYPGAEQISMKILFEPESGMLLGAQAVGGRCSDKTIDTLSAAIQAHMTMYDLEEMELAYAPQFGSAKNPINLAGNIAVNMLRGDIRFIHTADLDPKAFLLDVRTQKEFSNGFIPGAINIPIDELRQRIVELPRDRVIQIYCAVGKRSYNSARTLMQAGFNAEVLAGGYRTYQMTVM